MESGAAILVYNGPGNTGEVIVDRIGIREISIRDAVVYAMRFRSIQGVIRHDSDPVTGFVIGMEQMKKICR